MSKFTAATVLEPLEYDMNPYVDVKGTVPEPTDTMIATFYKGQAEVLEAALGRERTDKYDLTSPTDLGKLMLSFTVDDYEATYDEMIRLYAEVCQDKPNAEVLKGLPFRLRQAFYGAVQEWLRPEGSKPATPK